MNSEMSGDDGRVCGLADGGSMVGIGSVADTFHGLELYGRISGAVTRCRRSLSRATTDVRRTKNKRPQ